MEQRALLASALVLGCVTAAGAGGYLAVRQMAPSGAPAPAEQAATGSDAIATDPTQGTIAEVLPPAEAAAAPTLPGAAAAAGDKAAGPATATETSTRAEHAAPTPAASRPTPAAAPARVPSRPTPASRREETSPATRPTPAPASSPSADAAASSVPARTEEAARDTWPSRDSGTRPDDRWATSDPTNGSGADTSLPSRSPISETTAPPAPVRRLESVTIPADAVVGIQLEKGVSTMTARVEDPVRARVTRDLVSGGDVVIPAGARLLGNVTLVEEGGRVKERARLGIRFHTLVLSNGTEIKLPTETIYRDGESPAGRSAAKIGGAAVGGAILGALMGGGKGAVIGAATGAGSGTGWAMAGDRQPAELRAGQSLTVRVSDTVTTQVER